MRISRRGTNTERGSWPLFLPCCRWCAVIGHLPLPPLQALKVMFYFLSAKVDVRISTQESILLLTFFLHTPIVFRSYVIPVYLLSFMCCNYLDFLTTDVLF